MCSALKPRILVLSRMPDNWKNCLGPEVFRHYVYGSEPNTGRWVTNSELVILIGAVDNNKSRKLCHEGSSERGTRSTLFREWRIHRPNCLRHPQSR